MSSMAFEAAWKELRPRTVAMLVRRGTSRDVAEDIAQETAIRLLNNWHLLDEQRPTWPFVRRIALNCLIDRHRRERFDTLEDLPDRVGPYDVEEQSLARARLTEVWRAMAGLTQKERTILLAEVGGAEQSANDSATKMARHRARKKLTAAVARGGAFSGVLVTWRRMTGWVQLHPPAAYLDLSAAAGLVVIVSAAAVTLGQQPVPAHAGKSHTLRSTHVSQRRPEMRRAVVAAAPPQARAQRTVAHRAAAQLPSWKPSAHPSPTPTSTNAQAGPARAETRTTDSATYLTVCTGEETPEEYDDVAVTVTVGGEQNENGEAPECRHGEGP